jgi:hypothetical protein
VGLPKTGTTALQRLFAANRAELRRQGVHYPFLGPEAMFHAAVDVVGWHDRWGLSPEEVAGTWPALCRAAREHDGVTVISHELLGRARARAVAAALEPLRDLDVHVVVTARDLARQVTATWQERVKNGRRYSFEVFLEREAVLPARSRRHSAFWREQDLLAVARRWSGQLPGDHVHIVVCPPRGADPQVLVRRFCEVVGVDSDRLRAPDRAGAVNESLGAAQVVLLREVNIALGERLPQPAYAHVVKRHFAQQVLAAHRSPRALAPASLRRPFTRVTTEWAEGIQAAGYRVYGDLAELAPLAFDDSGGTPDRVPPDQVFEPVPDLLATLLLEVADLRFPGTTGVPAVSETTPPRSEGLLDRLGRRLRDVAGRQLARLRGLRAANARTRGS